MISDEPIWATIGLIVFALILSVFPLLGWLDPSPRACFATEESYSQLYTFELFL